MGDLARLDRADCRAAVLTAKIARMRERRERHSAMLADLVASGESQNRSRCARHGDPTQGRRGAQVAVDARHKLIVEQYVTNSGSDLGFLAQTASAARDVEQMAIDIAACEDLGVMAYVARPQRGPAITEGYFAKDEFRYDTHRDCYTTSVSIRILAPRRTGMSRSAMPIRDCALKPQCASGTRRSIDPVLERMAERLDARPDDRRRETVEHPFGTIKQWMNQGAFLMRGLANVNAEFSSLRRAINILGIPALLRAVQAFALQPSPGADKVHRDRHHAFRATSGPLRSARPKPDHGRTEPFIVGQAHQYIMFGTRTPAVVCQPPARRHTTGSPMAAAMMARADMTPALRAAARSRRTSIQEAWR
jgi:transposase